MKNNVLIQDVDNNFAKVHAGNEALQVQIMNPSASGGITEFARDSAAGATDDGNMILAVRDDGGGTLVSADGDYTPLSVNASGELRVTGGGGGTQYQEDDAHSSGATGTLALVIRNDTLGSLVTTDGDYAGLQVNADGALYTTIVNSTLAVTQSGAWAVTVSNFPATQTVDGTVNVGNTVTVTGAVGVSGTVSVDNFPATQAVTQSGSWTVAATQSGTWDIGTVSGAITLANVEQREDDPHTSGQHGIPALVVRQDTLASSTSANGDYANLKANAAGAVYTEIANTALGAVYVQPGTGATFDIGSVLPGTGSTNLGKEEDAAHGDGDVGVMALAVRKDGKGALVDTDGDYSPLQVDSGGHLRVTAIQSGTWDIGSITGSIIPGTGPTHLGKAEDSPHTNGDTGVMPLAVRVDAAGSPLAGSNMDYAPLIVDSQGRLRVVVVQGDPSQQLVTSRTRDGVNGTKLMSVVDQGDSVSGLGGAGGQVPMGEVLTTAPTRTTNQFAPLSINTSGRVRVSVFEDLDAGGLISGEGRFFTEPEYTKNEDAAHSNNAVGAFVLAVRQDTLASSTTADGDYAAFKVDERGALYTRTSTMREALSDSTDGQPIQITGTATGSANDLHDTTANEYDAITLDVTNTSDSAVTVTIELGGTGTGNEIVHTIAGNSTIRMLDRTVVGGSATVRTISCYASTGSVVNVFGHVERNV